MADMKIKLKVALATADKSLRPGNIVTRSKKDGKAMIDAGVGVEYTGEDEAIDETAAKSDDTQKASAPDNTQKAANASGEVETRTDKKA